MAKIGFIFTGGTIAMHPQTLEPLYQAQELLDLVPELSSLAEITAFPLFNIDSSELQPCHWSEIADAIHKVYDEFDGFVVVHGTDTMVYTAAALSFMLQNLSKPIILTGSQIPLTSQIGSDARNNLIYALRFALSDLAEVGIFFGSHLLRGNRAHKFSAMDIEAFATFGEEPLGSAGVELRLFSEHKKRKACKLKFKPQISEGVFLLKIFPGLPKGSLLKLAELNLKGLVLEAYGTGNIPLKGGLIKEISSLINLGIPVVVCSQCELGTAKELYPAGRSLKEAGALLVYNMTPETALVKLAWVLAATRNRKNLEALMLKNLTHEYHV
jgi:L-asparaginase